MEYKNENKICQNCHQDFTIEPEDFNFYEKISVPPPTWCPECRMIRRMIWRNQRSLYKRQCDLCKKNIISMYNQNAKFPVFCNTCFYSDKWDPMDYSLEIDWSKTFLEQWKELWNKTPKYALLSWGRSSNSEYSNIVIDSKDCYLSYSITDSEQIMYSENIDKSKSMIDSYMSIEGCDSCYYTQGRGDYACKYISQCVSCINCYFCFDCVNSQDCFMSYNLRNKKHVFRNKQLSPEEYKEALKKEKLGSRKSLENLYLEWKSMIENKAIHQYARIVSSKNSTGNFIRSAKNIKFSFNLYNSENIAFGMRVLNSKDSYDVYGLAEGELIYDSVGCSFGSSLNICSFYCDNNQNMEYSTLCSNNSNIFGCFSIKNKSNCILNKQYSKEDYNILVQKIKKQMNDMPYVDKKGRVYKYGEFMPFEFSPYGYNETICLDYFPISRQQAEDNGYPWFDYQIRDYKSTLKNEEIPNDINETNDSILSEILTCRHLQDEKVVCNHQCTNAFRVTNNEFIFYKKYNIPLPILCPNCRHYERLGIFIQPLKLWHRKCMQGECSNEFETAYAPERSEIVYCEKCYNAEIY